MNQNLDELLLKTVSRKDYWPHLQAVIESYGDDFSESEFSTQLQIFSSCFPKGQQKTIAQKEILSYLLVSKGSMFLQAVVFSSWPDPSFTINQCCKWKILLCHEAIEILLA